MDFTRGISLRYKLLALLVVLPLTSLSGYLFMASNLFVSDKKAYVFDSSVIVSRSLATQVKLELNSYERTFKPMVDQIHVPTLRFNTLALELFNNQRHIEHAMIYQRRRGGQYVQVDHLQLNSREVREIKQNPHLLIEMQGNAIKSGLAISEYSHMDRYFYIMQSFGKETDPNHFLTLVLYKASEVYEAFATPSLYKSYLLSKRRSIAMRPKYVRKHGDKIKIEDVGFFEQILNQKLPEGTAEINTDDGHPTLVSFSEVKQADLVVASVVDKQAAFEAVDNLVYRSLLFFLALICVTLVISVFSSISLTSALTKLVQAVAEIAKGNFSIRVNLTSKDEVGQLAEGFNIMAEEVNRLVVASAEQARMENELETVKVVQHTLFPQSNLKVGPIEIQSFFEPASECGGDWFFYSKVGNRVYLWIGDATGHGAPAALITSAARSAASIIEAMDNIPPGHALRVMNHALHQTAKGQILMTFFLGIIDLETFEMSYACASHEFPYVLPLKDNLKKKDLVPLCDASGHRLGENEDAEYNEATYQLNPGDTIFFYTDGIIDLQNPEGEELGERSFIKKLLEAVNKGKDLNGHIKLFEKSLDEFRGKAEMIDDVTFFMVHVDKDAKIVTSDDSEEGAA